MNYVIPLCALLLATAIPIQAQWQTNGIPVGAATGEQLNPHAAGDNTGVYVAWDDYRSGSSDIYIQKLGMNGSMQWTTNGAAAVTAADHQLYPVVVPDGSGGAIVVWEDYRSTATYGDIYAQRISSAGLPQWGTNGLLVCGAQGVQMRPAIASDGQGGTYIAWEDYRGATANIYVQHLSSAGAVSWASNGVRAATVNGARYAPVIVSAAGGGALVAWEENRVGTEYDIHAQYMNASGALQWGNGGSTVCTVTGFQTQLAGASDGNGGMLLVWQDFRNGAPDIYAQKITTTGAAWTNGGVAVCVATGAQEYPRPATDGQGGMFVGWTDFRNTGGDVYAQRLNAAGAAQWTGNGIAVCAASGTQNQISITTDGSGGAVLAWTDYRVANGDLFAQRLNAVGATLWQANGIGVCTHGATQQTPAVVPDQTGGAVIAWTDYRGSTGDIYAQRVNQYGTALPVELLSFSGARDGASVRLRWRTASETNLLGFEVQSGHEVQSSNEAIRGHEGTTFAASGFVFARHPLGGDYTLDIAGTDARLFRLRAVDLDGTETIFPVLRIEALPSSVLAITSLSPLPAHDLVTIGYDIPGGTPVGIAGGLPVRLTVYDLSGALRMQNTIDAPAGGRGIHVLPLGGLPSGLYVIELDAGLSRVRSRLPVLR